MPTLDPTRARTVRAGQAEHYRLSPTDTVIIHHGGDEHSLDLIEEIFGQYEGPPLHVHTDSDSYDLVLEGRVRFQIGDDQIDAGPGDFVFAPRGTPHTFANFHAEPARVIGVQSPGGFHRFFGELVAAMAGGAPDPEVIVPIAARHGGIVLGPPLAVSLGMRG